MLKLTNQKSEAIANSTDTCLICGSTHFYHVHTIHEYLLLKCMNCGIVCAEIVFQQAPSIKFLEELYDETYFSITPGPKKSKKLGYAENYFVNKRKEIVINAKKRLRVIEKLIPQKGRLLDVGCATGFFLEVARESDWQASGLELSRTAANYAREWLNLEVITDTFENAQLPENYYDVITAWDVIEHILRPHTFVEKAFKILKPAGLLVLGTPNIGSLAYKLRKGKWRILKPPEHVFYFDQKTLKMLMQKNFDTVVVKEQYPPFSSIPFTFKAVIKRVLYTGFNIIAKLVKCEEYMIGYAWKDKM